MGKFIRREADRYDVRTAPGEWAVLFLSEPGGVLSVVSSWGNWGYTWSNHGSKSLKHFLVGADTEYLMGKLGGKTYFDSLKTLQNIRGAIQRLYDEETLVYRSGRLAVMDAELLEEELGSLDYADLPDTQDGFFHAVEDALTISVDFSDVTVMTYDPALVHFMKRTWPGFVEGLIKELGEKS